MKKQIATLAAAAALVVTGCATIPTVEKMFTLSRAVGYAAGLVTNEIEMDAAVRNQVIDVWTEVAVCIPETNQTFEAAWTPIARRHVDELVKEGKIDDAQATLIMLAFNAAVNGVDYIFVRYPEAKMYKELTVAALDGFNEGFLLVFKPVNSFAAASGKESAYLYYDKEAYEYLKKLVK